MAAFDAMPNVNAGDVIVTRTANAAGTSFAYSLYFQGPSVQGQVQQVSTVSCGTIGASSVSVVTVAQGGFTEAQTVRVNVDSGYISGGGLFKLNVTSHGLARNPGGDLVTHYSTYTPYTANTTASCIPFGASATDVAKALQNVDILSAQLLPFTVTAIGGGSYGTNALTLSSSAFGILSVGQTVSFSDRTYPGPHHFTITKMISATVVLVNGNVSISSVSLPTYTGTSLHVFLVQPDSVVVSRHGTGNSTSTVVTISSSADSYVDPANNGYFRLKMTFGNKEIVSATCLKYNAAAMDVQNAINNLGFDFNGDGGYSIADYNHVQVSRSGDGSLSSGYGYVYTLSFTGPGLTFGSSLVLGNSEAAIEVMDEGHYGGCSDFNNTMGFNLNGLTVDYASASNGALVWRTTATTQGVLQPGDMVRLPTSATPYRVYRVLDTTKYSLKVDMPLVPFGVPQAAGFNLTVAKVQVPLPDFSVATAQRGEDSYAYDVYFTGPHLGGVHQLVPITCPACTTQACTHHQGGMLYGVDVNTKQDGGSIMVQAVSFQSTDVTVVNNPAKLGFWKLVFQGYLVYPPAQQLDGSGNYNGVPTFSKGYIWGAPAAVVQADINNDAYAGRSDNPQVPAQETSFSV